MKLQLKEKIQESANITTFIFQPETKLDFKPGQFLRYQITDPHPDERGEKRFFSISSAPFENMIQLTTKFVPGDSSTFKKDLQNLNPGDKVETFGPNGSFTLEDPKKQYVFIAGGIGITPFRSILLDLDHNQQPLNIILLYANRSQEALFKDEFENLAKKHPEFKIYYIVSDEPVSETPNAGNVEIMLGKIDKQLIQLLISNFQLPTYYISGPEPMMMAFDEMLKGMGVPKENIKRDYFPGYENF